MQKEVRKFASYAEAEKADREFLNSRAALLAARELLGRETSVARAEIAELDRESY